MTHDPSDQNPKGLVQLKRHLQEFLAAVDGKQKKQNAELSHQARAIARKNQHLIPLRQFLHGLAQCGVHVPHGAMHDPMAMTRHLNPQHFSVQEGESSPSWKPGISLYIDHPAPIEIAVSNPERETFDGLIVISCPDYHPKRHLLQGPFWSVDAAIAALSTFLVETTLRVDRPGHLQEFLDRLDRQLQQEGRSITGVVPGQGEAEPL